jgi:restriction system protein
VLDHVRLSGHKLESFNAIQGKIVAGTDGAYEIDVSAEFVALDAHFLVLIECKNQKRPVEREVVQVLHDRLRSTGAQKAMLFTTSGFQKGALAYARVHGIALIAVREGKMIYRTNGKDDSGCDGPKFSLWRCLLDEQERESWSSRETDPSDPFSIVQ